MQLVNKAFNLRWNTLVFFLGFLAGLVQFLQLDLFWSIVPSNLFRFIILFLIEVVCGCLVFLIVSGRQPSFLESHIFEDHFLCSVPSSRQPLFFWIQPFRTSCLNSFLPSEVAHYSSSHSKAPRRRSVSHVL